MAIFSENLKSKASEILKHCEINALTISTAESCTGGLMSALFTEIPGSSSVFERGFVTYSNEAKTEMLGVEKKLIDEHGAVSEQVALAMATGALHKAKSKIALAITGIAGPGGGSKEKPVGTVCIAVIGEDTTMVETYNFSGDRGDIRMQSVEMALKMIYEMLE